MTDFVEFYSKEYDEETRFQRHPTEFATTTYVLDGIIARGSKILDVGAGTGAYSLYYARKGCSVVAVDAVPRYIETLRAKIVDQPGLDAKALLADIRSRPPEIGSGYDVILFMGPVYHLPLYEASGCIDYCLGLLKTKGILAVSYVNEHEGHQGDKYPGMFITHTASEIEELLNARVSLLFHGPTDGEVFAEFNDLSQGLVHDISELHRWLRQHPSVFTDSRWHLTSIHGLYVGVKED